MVAIFWLISQEARVKLMQYQWSQFKEKVDILEMPKQAPHDPELEPEVDPELVRDMKRPPHSPSRKE